MFYTKINSVFFILIILVMQLSICNRSYNANGKKNIEHIIQLIPEKATLVNSKNANSDSFDIPYLEIELRIKNLTNKKVLYVCKAYPTDYNIKSAMFIINPIDSIPMIMNVNGFSVEFIEPNKEVKINALITKNDLYKMLNINSKIKLNLSIQELLNKIQVLLHKSFLIYFTNENDVIKYKTHFDSSLFLKSDTIYASLSKISLNIK